MKSKNPVSIKFDELDEKQLREAAINEGRTLLAQIRYIVHLWLEKYKRRGK